MAEISALEVKFVKELRSQTGPPYADGEGFDDVINAFLSRGWRIIETYVEDKLNPNREECVCLMGWVAEDGSPPTFPSGYGP